MRAAVATQRLANVEMQNKINKAQAAIPSEDDDRKEWEDRLRKNLEEFKRQQAAVREFVAAGYQAGTGVPLESGGSAKTTDDFFQDNIAE